MGLRDRLVSRIKRSIGQDSTPIVPRPPSAPPRPAAPPVSATPVTAEVAAEPPVEPPPVAAPPPQTTATPTPPPSSAPPAADADVEEARNATAPPSADAVERGDGHRELVPGNLPVRVHNMDDAEDGSWASDYATDDAPNRNAHYRQVFESTSEARRVRVIQEDEGIDVTFACEPGEFILDAADRAGQELPFSCRSGGCLSCSALLLSGEVEMGEQYVLEDEHISGGFFLLCCSTARTDVVLRSHQEDDIS